jgi:hypothetical protein
MMERQFPTWVLREGPHKGRTILGAFILGRVGSLRFSTRNDALERGHELGLNNEVTTEILEEVREVTRGGVTGPGKVFWVGIVD